MNSVVQRIFLLLPGILNMKYLVSFVTLFCFAFFPFHVSESTEYVNQTTVRTGSNVIFDSPTFIYGIFISTDGVNSPTFAFYDNTSSSGNQIIPPVIIKASPRNRATQIWFELPIRVYNGLFVNVTCSGLVKFMIYYRPTTYEKSCFYPDLGFMCIWYDAGTVAVEIGENDVHSGSIELYGPLTGSVGGSTTYYPDVPYADGVHHYAIYPLSGILTFSAITGEIPTAALNVVPSAASKYVENKVCTVLRQSSIQLCSSGTPITVSLTTVRVAGSGGAVTLNSGNAISDGVRDGQYLILKGTSETNTVQIVDNYNIQLSGGVSFTMGKGDSLELIWDSGDSEWYEVFRCDL